MGREETVALGTRGLGDRATSLGVLAATKGLETEGAADSLAVAQGGSLGSGKT